jgi:predicted O-methyltransferase YrrM
VKTILALVLLLLASACEDRQGEPYEFTTEWAVSRFPLWEKHLAPLEGRPGTRYLEIGTFEGRSVLWMAENIFTDESSRLVTIDPFVELESYGEVEARFDRNRARSPAGRRIVKMKGFSQQVLKELEPADYDVIYIDGCHLAHCVLTDVALSWPLLKVGGYLIFDDYTLASDLPAFGNPRLAIDAFLRAYRPFIRVVLKDIIVIVQKTKKTGDPE